MDNKSIGIPHSLLPSLNLPQRDGNHSCIRFTFHESKIIAIPKRNKDQTSPSGSRQISLLSFLFKLFERIILKKLPLLIGYLIIPEQSKKQHALHDPNNKISWGISRHNTVFQEKYHRDRDIDIPKKQHYHTAEYASPVWFNSPHTKLIDVKLNTTLRIITGCLKSPKTYWLSTHSDNPTLYLGVHSFGLHLSINLLSLERESVEFIIKNNNLYPDPISKIISFNIKRSQAAQVGNRKLPFCSYGLIQIPLHLTDECERTRLDNDIKSLLRLNEFLTNWHDIIVNAYVTQRNSIKTSGSRGNMNDL
ncbi:hypothetical protein RF11_00224 [Thelohanellus kitauei]|uniref:Uncharacterized protein n=1 Tax=Thelohanellus kitauei TaxID=669202 RepID=A0A0C2N466_THEKT|nr:hypothetical protein RF11_00224 [Thelohanellus kitauei]